MTSPESGSREPRGHYCIACNAAPCSEAVERFAEALVRAVEELPIAWGSVRWADGSVDEGINRAAVLAAISALRSPADTGEPR